MGFFDLFKRKRPAASEPATPSAQRVQRGAAGERPLPPQTDGGDDDAASGTGPERRERDRRSARPGTRILVVDDSPTIVALLKRMLVQNHFEVLVAYDGESGLEIARRVKTAAKLHPVFWITGTRIGLDVIPIHIFTTVTVRPLRFTCYGTCLAPDTFVQVHYHC